MSILLHGEQETDIDTPATGRARFFYDDVLKRYCFKDDTGTVRCFDIVDRELIEDILGGSFVSPDNTIMITYNDGANQFELQLDADINELNDVNITSLTDCEILKYDSASGKWINQTLVEAGINSTSYSESFLISDWVLVGGIYHIEITHNLNSLKIITNVWENESDQVVPERVEVVSANKIKIYTLFDPDCRYDGCITVLAENN